VITSKKWWKKRTKEIKKGTNTQIVRKEKKVTSRNIKGPKSPRSSKESKTLSYMGGGLFYRGFRAVCS